MVCVSRYDISTDVEGNKGIERTGNSGVGGGPLLRSTSLSSKGIIVPAILTPPLVRPALFCG